MFSTVQDRGRFGYQAFGLTVAGAMDDLSSRLANVAVGNEPGAAVVEMTLLGDTLRARGELVVALAGADAEARINGRPVPFSQPLGLKDGDELTLGRVRRGARCYLAAAGGIAVPEVLGSRATYTRASLGGLDGRALRAGDFLPVGQASNVAGRALRLAPRLPEAGGAEIRVILGPQDDHFSSETLKQFLSATFRVSNEADRMGYRLAGPPIHHDGPAEIVSDGIALGSIQVPPHGRPIVMMADRQTVGGYPKIATVISADVGLLAQCPPGTAVRFRAIDLEEAWKVLREREALLASPIAAAATNEPTGMAGQGLPVEAVRTLLSELRRTSGRQAAITTAGGTIRLRRG
ncbi:MAG: 5-oxoprolinase subunit C family protein [Chloroflexota bacterium]